jgi:hypothetical protein
LCRARHKAIRDGRSPLLAAFFSAFQDLLISNSHDHYYFDMFDVCLYFASEISTLISLISYSEAFLSPNVFDRDFFDIVSQASQKLYVKLLLYSASQSLWLFAEQVMHFLLHRTRKLQIRMFGSNGVLSAILLLQKLYLKHPNNKCYLARLKSSTTFLRASASFCFAAGYMQMLLEPDMMDTLFTVLASVAEIFSEKW